LAWALPLRAQQGGMRTIGYLSPRSANTEVEVLTAFRRGLRETGFIEGKNIAIEYRWAEGHYDRLPALAAELVNKQVAVIATTGGPHPVRAVRGATQAIPIVFASGSDPVRDGLVKSLNRPGGNATGVHNFTTQLGPKRLEVLRELVPAARLIGFIIHPTSEQSEAQVNEIEETGRGAE
jgi:putative tryptophan/tyrosine transport system substrate-binding protein